MKEEQKTNSKNAAFDAVVFDMDGIIFDSEQAVLGCWLEAEAHFGLSGIKEIFYQCLGTNAVKSKEIMKANLGDDFDFELFTGYASDLYHEKYDGGRLPKKPGIHEILEALKQAGKKIAVASSTRREVVVSQLRDAGLLPYFDEVICGDMITHSKPAPDIFLKACEQLKVSVERAYAIEDSFNGVRSANRAGLKTIMIPDLVMPTQEILDLTYCVVKNLLQAKEILSI